MTELSGIKHIFFDLDDTLWDFERNSSAVLQELYTEFELQRKLNTAFHDFHAQYKSINAALWREYNKGRIDKQELRNNRFHHTFMSFNYDNFEENLQVTEAYLSRSPLGTHLHEGCHEVLTYLKKKYRMHIITNGFKEVQQIKLSNSKLRDYFDEIIISEEHSINKPDTGIFRISEQKAGASPSECLMIGDSYETDIEGANAAGWKAIWFTLNATDLPVIHISRLPELKDLL